MFRNSLIIKLIWFCYECLFSSAEFSSTDVVLASIHSFKRWWLSEYFSKVFVMYFWYNLRYRTKSVSKEKCKSFGSFICHNVASPYIAARSKLRWKPTLLIILPKPLRTVKTISSSSIWNIKLSIILFLSWNWMHLAYSWRSRETLCFYHLVTQSNIFGDI